MILVMPHPKRSAKSDGAESNGQPLVKEYTVSAFPLFFAPGNPEGQLPAITEEEINELAARIDADGILQFTFAERQAQILRYAAEVAAITTDSHLPQDEKVTSLTAALTNWMEAISPDEEVIENDLADNGAQPAFSTAVCELFALLAQLYTERSLSAVLQHPSKVFPPSSYIVDPPLVMFELGRGAFLFFTDDGRFSIQAHGPEEAFDRLNDALSTTSAENETKYTLFVTDADSARESVRYAMDQWEEETGETWSEAFPEFEAIHTAYLDE